TIGGGRVDEPEHVQRGKVEVSCGCWSAQTVPLLEGQFIPLHNHDSIEWSVDSSRGEACCLQHDVDLLFFDWPPGLKIANGPTVADYFFEFHRDTSIGSLQMDRWA